MNNEFLPLEFQNQCHLIESEEVAEKVYEKLRKDYALSDVYWILEFCDSLLKKEMIDVIEKREEEKE